MNKNNNNNNNNNFDNLEGMGSSALLNDSFVGRIRIFLMIIFIGYFGIKIFYAPLKIYAEKYSYKTVELKGTDISENLLHDYTPGMWNSELNDFVILIILSILLFLFKFDTTFPKYNNKYTNLFLWIPFIVGLLIPPLVNKLYNKKNESNKGLCNSGDNAAKEQDTASIRIFNTGIAIEFFILIIIMIASILITILTNLNKNIVPYLVYAGLIIALCILLFVFRSKSTTYTDVVLNKYPSRKNNKCQAINYDDSIEYSVSDENKEYNSSSQRIIVKTCEDVLEPNLSFFAWIILLLMPFNNSFIMNIINGLVLGYFVSRVSFFGIQYPLVKKPSRFCKSDNPGECISKGISYSLSDTKNLSDLSDIKSLSQKLQNRINTNSWTIIGIAIIIISVVFMVMLMG